MKKLMAIIALIFLLAPLFAPLLYTVQAYTLTVYGNSNYNDSTGINLNAERMFLVNFTTGSDAEHYYFQQFELRIKDGNNFLYKGCIFNSSKHLLYVSDYYNCSDGSTYWQNMLFDDNASMIFEPSTTYWLGFICTGTGVISGGSTTDEFQDTTNSFDTPTDATDATWVTSIRPAVRIIVADVPMQEIPTAAPLPTGGSYDTSDTDAVIDTFAGYLVPLVLFLLPAFLLGFVTKWQKWPILIGLAIGSGLTYLFLGTAYVWLVFLVVIGMVGMAYQSMRGGGDHK